MDVKSRGLGKGLDALFESSPTFDAPITKSNNNDQNVVKVSMYSIDPNPDQPRRSFDKEKLQELANSISQHGILQPILLVKNSDRYMLVAGERRWRASKLAGLKEIPAIIKEFNDQQVTEIALIENLQRDDLNPIEEALGIKNLMEQFGLTQEEVGKKLGKSRPVIANSIRLLNLPDYIINYIIEGRLSAGHGRCLAGVSNKTLQKDLCLQVLKEELNVRQLESLVKSVSKKDGEEVSEKIQEEKSYPEFKEFQDILQKSFGMKVAINGSLQKGKITISYSKREELEGFYQIAKNLNN